MSKLVHVNDLNFEKEVLNSKLPVLIDVSAVWCAPCQRQLPILENFAAANLDKIKIVSLDIDEAPLTANKFGIRSVPTLMVFKNGQKISTKVGLTSQAGVEKLVSDSL